MEESNSFKKVIIIFIVILTLVVSSVFVITKTLKKEQKTSKPSRNETIIINDDIEDIEEDEEEEEVEEETPSNPDILIAPIIEEPTPTKPETTNSFNIPLIKKTNAYTNKKNYLISPYNIELALNILRDGADGNTKAEIDKLIGNRTITDVSVKDKISIANGVFIKDIYKSNVKKDYYNVLKSKYNSDIIYDKFTTPDKINNWVKEKTNNMIDNVVDELDKDFVMGLASALAIDVKWYNQFECNRTTSEKFTKANGNKINVEMMHNSYDHEIARYIKTDDVEGIALSYQKNNNIELEFIGLLPTSDVNTFINNLTDDKLNSIINGGEIASSKLHINLSLPRFTYDYSVEKFKNILIDLGMKDAFDPDNANFKKMIELKQNVYVEKAVHKTHIELNEVGTKAAAVTYFGMDKNTALPMEQPKIVNIKFNKPFIYMIREKNSKELLFFGVVYEPNIWKGSTCSNNDKL